MRQLTAYASYCNNLGELLIGRARFYNLDGSPAQVFGLDNAHEHFITLGTSVYTNSSGQLTPQVFLANHDYLIVFDKYIGDGTMSEDDDPESWEEQGSAVDYYNTLGVELLGQTTRVVKTMDDLKDTQPLADDEIILLLGYNTPGDKPPIYYKWNASVIAQDNGGSIVQVGEQERGRWMFIDCPISLDVRHFGAFPAAHYIEDTEQRYAIQRAGEYAHENNCGIYFPSSDSGIYYDISGLTLYDVDCNPAARVFVVDDSQASINGIEKIYCGGDTIGRITLTNPTVRSSWEGEYRNVVLNPTEKLIIDKQLYPMPRTWRGIQVEMKTYCGPNMIFDDCIITANGVITGPVTIQNCELKTEWFSDDYNWNDLNSYGNTILLQNCKDATTYIKLKNKQNDSHYGDLGEQTISDATLLSGAIAENFSGTATLLGDAEIHNASGTLTLNWNTPSALNLIDCWLTLVLSHSIPANTLQLRRGQLSGAGIQVLGSVLLNNVHLEMPMNVTGGTIVFDNCEINAAVSHIGSPVTETIKNCIFNSPLTIAGGNANAVVNAVWQNNVGMCQNPLVLDRTNLDPDDANHTYVYEGNSGTFLPSAKNAKHTYTLTVSEQVINERYDGYVGVGRPEGSTDIQNSCVFFLYQAMPEGQEYPDHGIPYVKMFRVGTNSFNAKVDWTVTGGSFGHVPIEFIVAPMSFGMVMKYLGNDLYHACVRRVPYNLSGINYWTTPIAHFRRGPEASWTGALIQGTFWFSAA